MTEPVPMTREERRDVLIEALGGLDAFAAYIAAGAALHNFAKHVPGALGLDVADIYKAATLRLDQALRDEEERRRS